MNDPFYLLTPDELIRANVEIKLLKLELERNVLVDPFRKEVDSDTRNPIWESINTLEEMQKEPGLRSVYDLIEQPSFQPDTDLTDPEIRCALLALRQRMYQYGIVLKILAPEDYSDRTIYRFITNELFQYETPCLGEGETTQFVYEEFHLNHRYAVVEQGEKFVKMVVEGRFNQLNRCLGEQFLDRQVIPYYHVGIRPEVTDHINDLIEGWWPRTLRHGSVVNVQIAEDTETAQATLLLHLDVRGDTNHVQKEGTMFLSRYDLWWVIERIQIDDWVLQ